MKTRVDFPDGTHAILREKVNVRGRKALERTSVPALRAMRRIRSARQAQEIADGEEPSPQEQITYTEQEIYAMQRMEYAGIMACIAHWSRDEPVPRTIDEVEDMEPEVYEALATEVRPRLWELLGVPDTSVNDALNDDGTPKLDHPTGPSPASNGDGSTSTTPIIPNRPLEIVTDTSSTSTESGLSEDATQESPTSST